MIIYKRCVLYLTTVYSLRCKIFGVIVVCPSDWLLPLLLHLLRWVEYCRVGNVIKCSPFCYIPPDYLRTLNIICRRDGTFTFNLIADKVDKNWGFIFSDRLLFSYQTIFYRATSVFGTEILINQEHDNIGPRGGTLAWKVLLGKLFLPFHTTITYIWLPFVLGVMFVAVRSLIIPLLFLACLLYTSDAADE